MEKKNWVEPQLIVLTRGTPDESVLAHCKIIGDGTPTHPTGLQQDGCNNIEANMCGNCQSRSGS
jgi:hypothetical protein